VSTPTKGFSLPAPAFLGIDLGRIIAYNLSENDERQKTLRLMRLMWSSPVLSPPVLTCCAIVPHLLISSPPFTFTDPVIAMKILVADDEPEILDIYGEMLGLSGYEVTGAQDGHEALDRFRTGEYDLVVMDLYMPRMDGFQSIAEMQKLRAVPILVMTGHYPAHAVAERLRSMDLDVHETLTKPVTVTTLLNAIKRLQPHN